MAAMVPLFSDETKPSLAEKDDVSQVAYYRSRATADDMALEAERSAQRQEDDRGYRQGQQQKEQIERKVKQIVTDCLLLTRPFTRNDSFVDLGAEEEDIIELMGDFERAFRIEIPSDEAEHIRTVQDAVDYMFMKINQ